MQLDQHKVQPEPVHKVARVLKEHKDLKGFKVSRDVKGFKAFKGHRGCRWCLKNARQVRKRFVRPIRARPALRPRSETRAACTCDA